MKFKIKVIVMYFLLIIFLGTGELISNANELKKENKPSNVDVVSIMDIAHPFYDAKILEEIYKDKIISDNEIKNTLKVLSKYTTNERLKELYRKIFSKRDLSTANQTEFEDIMKSNGEVGKNPFLIKYTELLFTKLNKSTFLSGGTKKTNGKFETEKAISSTAKGFLSPVMVVDALGSFIAKRFKEELTIAYLEKFKKILKKNKDKGWTLLVPTTFTFLENSEPFYFKVFLSTLKQSFHNDLNNLDINIKDFLIKHKEKIVGYMLNLLEDKNCDKEFQKILRDTLSSIDDEIRISVLKLKRLEKNNKFLSEEERLKIIHRLRLVLWKDHKGKLKIFFIKAIKDRKSLPEYKKILGIEKSIRKKDSINLAITILDVVQEVKKGKHPMEIIEIIINRAYINQMDNKISDPMRILALISRNLVNKEGDGWIRPNEFKALVINSNKNYPEIYLGLLCAKEYIQLEKIFCNGSKTLNNIINENIKYFETASSYIYKMLKITNSIQNKIKELELIRKEDGFKKYYSYMETFFELIEHGFGLKDFFEDDLEKISIIKKNQKNLVTAKKLLELSKNINEKAYGVALVNTVTILKDLLPKSVIKDEIIKYGTFMVSMVEAKDAKEMGKVISAAALPVGSYRIKRTHPFTISLNSYAGIFGNSENLSNSNDEEKQSSNIAFTAPVGLAMNFFGGRKHKTSHSIFLSIIDVGAVVRFRLGDEETKLDGVEWRDVLAPGLFYIWGLRDSIISIGLGVQYGPKLTNVLENGTPEITPSRIRYGVMFVVDIPIFHFK